MVGDPSGRKKEREGLNKDSLEKNKSGIKEDLLRVFSHANDSTSNKTLPLMYVCSILSSAILNGEAYAKSPG